MIREDKKRFEPFVLIVRSNTENHDIIVYNFKSQRSAKIYLRKVKENMEYDKEHWSQNIAFAIIARVEEEVVPIPEGTLSPPENNLTYIT
jgi:hypothetical protein